MATNQHYSNLGPLRIVDKRNVEDANNPISATAHAATRSQATLDTQLATLNGTYYTAAMLQGMNLNDKLFALRMGYDSAGI
jgi:hypothetical protein